MSRLTSTEQAQNAFKRMRASNDSNVAFHRLHLIAKWLSDETGEEWDIDRVRDDFVVPAFKLVIEGASVAEAENAVRKAIGVQPRYVFDDGRDVYGRRRVKR